MNQYLNDIGNYFLQLAYDHPLLQHNRATEADGTPERHFFRGELEEFFQRIRAGVRYPCLILESFETSYGGTLQQTLKTRTGSFIVADRYETQQDYAEMELIKARCERIADDLIGRMVLDCETGAATPFLDLRLEDFSAVYLENQLNKYVGYRVSFESRERCCLAK